ncbi:hypothetical protein BGW39_009478 [Mortierella sp. 14UC]|nr:hypothetical protein BGW39_009478 [Mortierella sp. 14UC]
MVSIRHHWTTFIERVKSLLITLETFHLSHHRWSSPDKIELLALEVCPDTSEYCLWAPNVSPAFMKALALHTSRLTTLELYWANRDQPHGNLFQHNLDLRSAPALVFKYLCMSSNAAHLKTLRIPVFHPDMDLFYRGKYIPSFAHGTFRSVESVVPPSSPGIWRCRNLQALRLDFLDHKSLPL